MTSYRDYRNNNQTALNSKGNFYPNLSQSEDTLRNSNTRDSMNMDDAIPYPRNGSSLKHRVIQTITDLVVIIIIFIIFGIVYFVVDPKIRFFTCNDTDIFFPYRPDTVPFWAVGIYGAIGPILFIILIELLNARVLPLQHTEGIVAKQRWRKFFVCFFHGISLFALGISLTLCLTEIGKRWMGRLRPHFIAVCDPDWNLIRCTNTSLSGSYFNFIYTGDNFCRGDPAKVKEARFSFPSGHSSFSWYTMCFLIVFVEARLQLLKLRYIKPLVQMAAFIAAYVTAISRIPDYHHRGSDVIGGSVLGIVIALFVTLVVGRVLWDYECEKRYSDYDLKARNHTKTVREF